jgi:hypothetical protein
MPDIVCNAAHAGWALTRQPCTFLSRLQKIIRKLERHFAIFHKRNFHKLNKVNFIIEIQTYRY